MKTETESQAIIVREGKLVEDAKESVENRRIFWLMENERCGIRFRVIDRTPELAIASAESLVRELGKYQAVHALAAYRSDTRIGILKIYSRSQNGPPQRLLCGDITEGVPLAQPTSTTCPLPTVEELTKELKAWENSPENPHGRRPNPFARFRHDVTPG
jgi:hypothetical protein